MIEQKVEIVEGRGVLIFESIEESFLYGAELIRAVIEGLS